MANELDKVNYKADLPQGEPAKPVYNNDGYNVEMFDDLQKLAYYIFQTLDTVYIPEIALEIRENIYDCFINKKIG